MRAVDKVPTASADIPVKNILDKNVAKRCRSISDNLVQVWAKCGPWGLTEINTFIVNQAKDDFFSTALR